MKETSANDIEIRAIQRAYDELKCLDPDGRERALAWLIARFEDERIQGLAAQETARRERIARRAHPTSDKP